MKQMFLLSLILLSLGMTLSCEGGMFRNLGHAAHPWRFDGREFVPGAGEGGLVVLVRDGYLPVLRTGDEAVPSASLPNGIGAIAGICYVQVTGGKLRRAAQFRWEDARLSSSTAHVLSGV